MIRYVLFCLLLLDAAASVGTPAALAAQAPSPVSFADVIRMVHIQADPDNPAITVSPDGRTAAFVTWWGDLARNVNVYQLHVFDIAQAIRERRLPAPVMKLDVVDEGPLWTRTRVVQLRLHTDRRTGHPVATFLFGKPQQVHAVDAITKQVRVLTRHPSDVRTYAMGPDGNVAIYAAAVDDSTNRTPFIRHARIIENGVIVLSSYAQETNQQEAAPDEGNGIDAIPEWEINAQVEQPPAHERVLHYFTLSSPTAAPRRVLACSSGMVGKAASQRWCTDIPTGGFDELSVSPDGRHALLWPYVQAGPVDELPSYALVNLGSGHVAPLVDARKDAFDARHIWSPDGRSVVVATSDPRAEGAKEHQYRLGARPIHWIEVDIDTKTVTQLDIPYDWRPISWDSATNTIFLRGRVHTNEHFRLATAVRSVSGWGRVREVIGTPADSALEAPLDVRIPKFNPRYLAATNGRVVLGVVDNLATPPEIAAFDLGARTTTILSNLNPELERRRLGRVLPFRWRSPNDSAAFGCLVLPPDTVPRGPVPVVMLFDRDHCANPARPSFLLEGPDVAKAISIHTLASSGIAVFLLRGTKAAVEARQAPNEGAEMQSDYESAIRALAAAGLIDSTRVGISGWSYGAEVTDLLLTRSSFPFAAASKVDGGNFHYGANRSWTHAELMNINAPYLIEAHGQGGVTNRYAHGIFVGALRDLGKPVEFLYFPTAAHGLITPKHRWRALNMQTDWFRFWLQDYEDPDPAKREQYERWRELAGARDSLH